MPRVTLGSFVIDVPTSWTLSTVILVGPPDETPPGKGLPTTKAVRPFQRNLIATMEQVDPGTTIDVYLKRQIDGLRQAGVSRSERAKPEKVQLQDGEEGVLLEQIIIGPTGERVRQMQLICIKEDVAHTLIASHLDGPTFDAVRADYRLMLLSFR